MKILKQGTLPKKMIKYYKKTCDNCGCEFEFSENECLYNLIDGIKINCPCCAKTLYPNKNDFLEEREEVDELIPKETDFPKYVPNVVYTSSTPARKCEDCEFFRRYLAKGEPYVGDTPCQWWPNGTGICVTCDAVAMESK